MNHLESTSSQDLDNLYRSQTDHFYKICKQIDVQNFPFVHLEQENLFEPTFYQYICDILPGIEKMNKLINDSPMVGKDYSEKRYSLMIKDFHHGFKKIGQQINYKNELIRLYEWFNSILVPKLADLLGVDLEIKTHDEFLYGIDMRGFSLFPHTDIPEKIMSILIYMPEDDSIAHAGTNILTPKDPSIKRSKDPSDFEIYKTTKFIPNNTFSFKRSEKSFHSVSLFDQSQERRFLLFTVVSNKVLTR